MSAPAWLVVGVILAVLCKLAIQAAVALECWSAKREADAEEHGRWHRKHAGPDARRSGRDHFFTGGDPL